MSSIVLTFVQLPSIRVQLPIQGIQTSVTAQFSDGTPDQTWSANYPFNPSFSTSSEVLTVTVTGDFAQFGDPANPWPGAAALVSVSSWDGIASFAGAFYGCTTLNYVPPLLPNAVSDCRFMFCRAVAFTGLGLVETWDVSAVQTMASMFRDSGLNADLSAWNLASVSDMSNMLNVCNLSSDLYTAALIGWSVSPTVPTNIVLGALGLIYDSATATPSIQTLTILYGWTIVGQISSDNATSYSNIVALEWFAPVNTNGTTILQYAIQVVTETSVANYTTVGTETSYLIDNLDYNVQYLFYVAAITNAGLSDYSAVSNPIFLVKQAPYVAAKRYATWSNKSCRIRYADQINAAAGDE